MGRPSSYQQSGDSWGGQGGIPLLGPPKYIDVVCLDRARHSAFATLSRLIPDMPYVYIHTYIYVYAMYLLLGHPRGKSTTFM